MQIKTIVVGHVETNCYIVTNENNAQCVIIDPGDESNSILDYVEDNHLTVKAIMLTHGHFDHVGAVETISEETGAVVYMNCRDDFHHLSPLFPYSLSENGVYYDDGDVAVQAGMEFRIIATPGHSQGSVSIICGDALFSGDTLFKGSCGRYDLEGSDGEEEMRSLKKLCELQEDYDVYPGHGDSTTLIREKNFNYYCREAKNY